MTFLPETVKSTFIELVKSVFRYIYLKVSIEALSLKVAIVSKADLASLGQSDIDMLSQFYLFFFFNEELYTNILCSYSSQEIGNSFSMSKNRFIFSIYISILTGT